MYYMLNTNYVELSDKSKYFVIKNFLSYILRNWFSVAFVVLIGTCMLYEFGSGPVWIYSYDKFVWDDRC